MTDANHAVFKRSFTLVHMHGTMGAIRVAIASNSLGKSAAGHTINRKLEAAKAHGFDGVEVAIECLDAHASSSPTHTSRAARLRAAAADVRRKATELGLSLIALNPFGAYDGLTDPGEIKTRLDEAELWFQLCALMDIPIFQVLPTCSTFDHVLTFKSKITSCLYPIQESRITPDINAIANNMRRLGLLAQKYHLVVAYEAPAWGIHLNRWQQIHEVIKLVNLPNVQHCLDTFHISTKEACDPFNAAAPIRPNGPVNVRRSLDEMRQTVKPSQIGYLQLSDATIARQDQEGYPRCDLMQPAYMTQSRNCRIFPCEPQSGGILPAVEVAQAVFDIGYTGWVSMEVFHTDLFDPRPS